MFALDEVVDHRVSGMANLVQTDHPHIVRREGVCGGEPVIDGLRVAVHQVVALRLRGEPIPDIAEALNVPRPRCSTPSATSPTTGRRSKH